MATTAIIDITATMAIMALTATIIARTIEAATAKKVLISINSYDHHNDYDSYKSQISHMG